MLTVLLNATVWTPDGDVQAIAVQDGRISAFGDSAQALADTADEIIDIGGGFVMPAFGDGHCHPLQAGYEQLGPPIRPAASIAEIIEVVGRFAAEHHELEWIIGGSYDSTLSPNGLFDARWLDAAVADRPVVLRAWDYHTVWCNTEAMRRAGLDDTAADTDRGTFARRPDGSLMGTMLEWDAVDAVLAAVPAPSVADSVRALRFATDAYASAGVSWLQDAWVDHADVDSYLAAAQQNALHVRVNLAFRADPSRWRDDRRRQLDEFAADRVRVQELAHPRLTANTVKFFVDGVVESATASMLEAYSDDPCSRGMPIWNHDDLVAAVIGIDALGFQPHLHAIGDAGVRAALDAVGAAVEVNPARDRRAVIAHVQVVDPLDLPRFHALGVIANFQPLWAQVDDVMRQLTLPRLGKRRSQWQYPIGTLTRSGAHVAFGSDWPVSDHRPLSGVPVAVTRQTADGQPPQGWTPTERVDVETAIRCYTAGVAYQAFAEQDRGSLVLGSQADLVWLAADPRTTPPDQIARIEVLGTWLAGDCIFRR
jgi:predicted amidohydrolase YtcJ